jgi:hypothetical protein
MPEGSGLDKRRLNGQSVRIVFVIAMLICLTAPMFLVKPASADSEYIQRTFEWSYNHHDYTWTLNIPTSLYKDYNSVPESTRDAKGLSGYGFLTTTKDPYVRMLAEKLNESANSIGYNSYDQVSFILAFVQSLPYTSDSVTTGYDNFPRFPIETLVADGGDCEDTAILFATLTLILGYGTVYINPEGHLAVGVLGNDLDGSYYTYNNKTYYYCETTGDGWSIGELPDEWKDETAHIYTINTNLQYTPNLVFTTPSPSPVSTAGPSSVVTVQPSLAPPTSRTNTLDTGDHFDSLLVVGVIVIVIVIIIAAFAGSQKKKHQPNASMPMPPPPPPQTQGAAKFCAYCGAPNSAAAVYCSTCGKPAA